jgi:hypothetical protein
MALNNIWSLLALAFVASLSFGIAIGALQFSETARRHARCQRITANTFWEPVTEENADAYAMRLSRDGRLSHQRAATKQHECHDIWSKAYKPHIDQPSDAIRRNLQSNYYEFGGHTPEAYWDIYCGNCEVPPFYTSCPPGYPNCCKNEDGHFCFDAYQTWVHDHSN